MKKLFSFVGVLLKFGMKSVICPLAIVVLLVVAFAKNASVFQQGCAVVAILAIIVVWIDPASRHGK